MTTILIPAGFVSTLGAEKLRAATPEQIARAKAAGLRLMPGRFDYSMVQARKGGICLVEAATVDAAIDHAIACLAR